MRVRSNYQYITSPDVLTEASLALCHLSSSDRIYPPEGEWMVAAISFHLRGGWGGCGASYWEDPGAIVKEGERFRLTVRGNPERASEWEIEQ